MKRACTWYLLYHNLLAVSDQYLQSAPRRATPEGKESGQWAGSLSKRLAHMASNWRALVPVASIARNHKGVKAIGSFAPAAR